MYFAHITVYRRCHLCTDQLSQNRQLFKDYWPVMELYEAVSDSSLINYSTEPQIGNQSGT